MEDKVHFSNMATSSKDWIIPEKINIGYGHQKRTIGQMCRKVLNTILSRLAYTCPINSWRIQFHRWRGVHIGKNVYLGMYCIFDNLSPEYIYIKDNVSVNANTMIITHFNPVDRFDKAFEACIRPVVIEEKAMVSVRCTILPGVHIGEYSVISAGMVIDKDVPANVILREKKKRELVDLTFLYNK